MKNDYLKFITFLFFFSFHCTTSFSQTITTQIFSEGRVSYEWQAEKNGAFHLSINQETQTMVVIPLSPDFQGIKSISIYQNGVEDSIDSDTILCTTNFIVPWHPDSRHEVPLPIELFDCAGNLKFYHWRVVWMMEETEVVLREVVLNK
jgi:hypothetical protein